MNDRDSLLSQQLALLITSVDSCCSLHPDESAFDGDEITDLDALLTPLKAQYGAFFAQPTRLPTDVVSPPVTAAPPLTKEDVRRMSQEDINRNWSSVCSVLSKGD